MKNNMDLDKIEYKFKKMFKSERIRIIRNQSGRIIGPSVIFGSKNDINTLQINVFLKKNTLINLLQPSRVLLSTLE
jgi:hypothetical protein